MAYRIIPIFVAHEGCPHKCVFCNQKKIASDHSVTPEEVGLLLQYASQNPACHGAEVAFYGGSFTAIPKARQIALLEAVKPFLADGIVTKIRISTRPDCIDDETLARLWHCGIRTIELGVQTMSDEVLCLSNRGHTTADVVTASKKIKAYGFQLGLQVMAGLPGDTRETCLDTVRKVIALQPDFARIYPVAVLEHTALAELWRSGAYTPLTVPEAADIAGEMLELFLDAHIPVIRIGLNPTEELSGGAVLAGGYHPALGEMVRSRVYRSRAERLLSGTTFDGQDAVLLVPKGAVSMMTGVKRENMDYFDRKWKAACGYERLLVREDEGLSPYEVRLHGTDACT